MALGFAAPSAHEEVERLFGLLGDGKIDNHQNSKGRFKDNSDNRCAAARSNRSGRRAQEPHLPGKSSLSFREKRMLDRAKFLIIPRSRKVMRDTAAWPSKVGSTTRSSVAASRPRRAPQPAPPRWSKRPLARSRPPLRGAPRARRNHPRALDLRRQQSSVRESPARRVEDPAASSSIMPRVDHRRRLIPRHLPGRLRLRALRRADRHAAGDDLPLVRASSRLRHERRAPRPRAVRHQGPRRPRRAHSAPPRRRYCANHQSNVDPPILFDKLHPRMHIVYKVEEINAIPLLARAFRHRRVRANHRRNKKAAMRSLEAGASFHPVGQLVPDLP